LVRTTNSASLHTVSLSPTQCLHPAGSRWVLYIAYHYTEYSGLQHCHHITVDATWQVGSCSLVRMRLCFNTMFSFNVCLKVPRGQLIRILHLYFPNEMTLNIVKSRVWRHKVTIRHR